MNLLAWDPIDKKMGVVDTYHPKTGKVMFEKDTWDWYKRDRIVRRPTGLKDKNGKEIYEGDILRHTRPHWGHKQEQLRLVEWKNESSNGQLMNCGLKFSQVGRGMFTFYTPEIDLEIVGNIYANPELLGEDKHE